MWLFLVIFRAESQRVAEDSRPIQVHINTFQGRKLNPPFLGKDGNPYTSENGCPVISALVARLFLGSAVAAVPDNFQILNIIDLDCLSILERLRPKYPRPVQNQGQKKRKQNPTRYGFLDHLHVNAELLSDLQRIDSPYGSPGYEGTIKDDRTLHEFLSALATASQEAAGTILIGDHVFCVLKYASDDGDIIFDFVDSHQNPTTKCATRTRCRGQASLTSFILDTYGAKDLDIQGFVYEAKRGVEHAFETEDLEDSLASVSNESESRSSEGDESESRHLGVQQLEPGAFTGKTNPENSDLLRILTNNYYMNE